VGVYVEPRGAVDRKSLGTAVLEPSMSVLSYEATLTSCFFNFIQSYDARTYEVGATIAVFSQIQETEMRCGFRCSKNVCIFLKLTDGDSVEFFISFRLVSSSQK
jgi:hypothetical protein